MHCKQLTSRRHRLSTTEEFRSWQNIVVKINSHCAKLCSFKLFCQRWLLIYCLCYPILLVFEKYPIHTTVFVKSNLITHSRLVVGIHTHYTSSYIMINDGCSNELVGISTLHKGTVDFFKCKLNDGFKLIGETKDKLGEMFQR